MTPQEWKDRAKSLLLHDGDITMGYLPDLNAVVWMKRVGDNFYGDKITFNESLSQQEFAIAETVCAQANAWTDRLRAGEKIPCL